MVKRGVSKKLCSKAQYATEVLMTYGWALILISGVFAALFYFDVLSLQDMKPDVCTLSPGLICDEVSVHPNNFSIKIVNGMGEDVKITSMTFTNKDLDGKECSQIMLNKDIANGASEIITVDPCPVSADFESGHKQMFDVDFKFTILTQQFKGKGRVFTYVAE